MPRSGKNNERGEQVRKNERKPARIEPLRPQAEHPDKLYNDLAKFPEENPYPVLRIHKDGTILYANKAGEPLLKAKGSGMGQPAPAEWRRVVEEVLKSGRVARKETKHEGRIFAFRAAPIVSNDYVNLYGTDITEQKMAEEERELTIKLLSLINSSNRMQELMKLVTVLLKDWSECEAVGIRLQEGEDFPYFVTSGFSDEFILAENKLCSVNKLGEIGRDSQGRPFLECMCGNIISGRFDPNKPFFTSHGSFWTNSTTDLLASTTEADRLTKTRNRCNTAGYESVALVPLRAVDQTFGLLQFNSKQKDRFTPEKISLLERLADNLSIGLAQRKAEESLRESENKFKTLADESFDSIVIHDGEKIIEVNKAFGRLWGYGPGKAAGLKVDTFFAPECWGDAKKRIQAGYDKPYEAVAIRKDGTRFQVEIAGKAITYKGKTARIATARDITERKRAEEALQASEERFRSLFEQAADAIVVIDARTGKIVEFNDKAHQMLGYTRTEYAKLRLSDIEAIESKEEVAAHIDKVVRQGSDIFEVKQRKKDGTLCDVLVSSKLITVAGKPYLQAIWRDITQIKKNEEQLQEERNLLRTLIDHIPDGVFVKDKDSRFVVYNKTLAERWPEEGKGAIIGKTDFDLFEHTIAQHFFNEEQEVMRTGNPLINSEGQYVKKCGKVIHNLTTKVPLRDTRGNVIGIVGINRDITERKKAEDELIRLNRVMETITNVNQLIFRMKDSEEMLRKVCEMIVRYAYRMVWIGFCDEKSKQIVPQAQAGFEEDYLESIKITYDDSEYGMGPSGMAVKTAGPNVMQFISTDQRFEPWRAEAIKRGYRSSAAIPIFGEDKVIGTLNVYADKDDAFNQEEVKLLEELSHDISTGLRGIDELSKRQKVEHTLLEHQRQLKRLASQLTLAEERERHRIAGELHDHVSQSLALAKIKLDSLRAALSSQPLAGVIEDISGSIEKAIQDTRSLTFDLSSPILYELGFEAAVAEWLNEQLRDKHGIDVDFQDVGLDKPLDNDVRAILFRNVRESLINIIKHSNARKVSVSVQRSENSIKVTIEDNGIGFVLDEERKTSAKTAKFGLFSVRESLEQLGGRFEVESNPGAGCKVTMTAPLKNQTLRKEK